MARTGRKSRIEGADEFAALLRRKPLELRRELMPVLEGEVGPKIKGAMQAKAPKRTGALRAGIDFKGYPATLRVEIGLLTTSRGRSDLFYGRIQDLGRVESFWAGRYKLKGGGYSKDVFRKTPAMAGKRFITGRHTEARRESRASIQAVVGRVLGQS